MMSASSRVETVRTERFVEDIWIAEVVERIKEETHSTRARRIKEEMAREITVSRTVKARRVLLRSSISRYGDGFGVGRQDDGQDAVRGGAGAQLVEVVKMEDQAVPESFAAPICMS